MFTTLLLSSALTAGQVPVPPGAYWPAAQPYVVPAQAQPMPGPAGPMGQPAPVPGGLPAPATAAPAPAANGNGNGNGCDACGGRGREAGHQVLH